MACPVCVYAMNGRLFPLHTEHVQLASANNGFFY